MENYVPIYESLFEKYDYTWEDLDMEIYEAILHEENYTQADIDKEMKYLSTSPPKPLFQNLNFT